ncbi:MAG TPA: LysR family transcriptional regulator [Xanthobacteraceae bacterium]
MVCLDALLAERSVSRAAKRVFLSQPAMSISLKKIRQYFDDDIAVQVGRTLKLTPFAESLQKPVRDAILQMRAISEWKPNFDPAQSDREILLEASDYITAVYMTRVFERAYAEAPRIRFDLRILGPTYIDAFESGEIDVLVIPEAVSSGKHPREPLFSDTFSCVVWEKNSLVSDRMSKEQYLKMGHVMTEWDGGRLAALDETLLAHSGYTRRQEIAAPSFSLAPQFVVGTNRVATVQTRLANKMALQWPLRVLPCPIEIPPIVESVQWHKYQERDPAILWFLGVLRSVALELSSPSEISQNAKIATSVMERNRQPRARRRRKS